MNVYSLAGTDLYRSEFSKLSILMSNCIWRLYYTLQKKKNDNDWLWKILEYLKINRGAEMIKNIVKCGSSREIEES